MANSNEQQPLRWLHLSDFHIGANLYGQRRAFKYIKANIEAKIATGWSPDFVFFTGDIANRGQKDEYKIFFEEFLDPVVDLLGGIDILQRTFIIPGNHDVTRDEGEIVERYDIFSKNKRVFYPNGEGMKLRKPLFPRFENFAASDMCDLTPPGKQWLFSEEGYYSTCLNIGDQTIGILCLNTAWLCGSDKDRGHLTPGRDIVEVGLEQIEACDVKIVLGHHSIDWFMDEEGDFIRPRFGKNHIIYLHGDLHKSGAIQTTGGSDQFLIIRAGASYQEHNDPLYVNKMMWCELHTHHIEECEAHKEEPYPHVQIEALEWEGVQGKWLPDMKAFPDGKRHGDYWVFPSGDALDIPRPAFVKNTAPTLDIQKLALPSDWKIIKKGFLDRKRHDLSEERILRYFNGSIPEWEDALSPRIPRRKVVSTLIKHLQETRQQRGLFVSLLSDASGEGKSTALRQVVCDIACTDNTCNIVWHDAHDNPSQSLEWIRTLPLNQGAWLIVSDEADLIAKKIFNEVKFLHANAEKYTNLQFLLCYRGIDWRMVKAHEDDWNPYLDADIFEVNMGGTEH